ncbi:MAG: HPr family phosphocarrier protein [Spirochaetes bacterium]|nr:HPr family phosphocarrier protein [Spirochaetota bacterium]
MVKHEVVVKWRAGLHARPASELVKLANRFQSRITIKKSDMEIDGKSVIGIMTLGAAYKTQLTIIIDGNDENEALSAIIELFDKA